MPEQSIAVEPEQQATPQPAKRHVPQITIYDRDDERIRDYREKHALGLGNVDFLELTVHVPESEDLDEGCFQYAKTVRVCGPPGAIEGACEALDRWAGEITALWNSSEPLPTVAVRPDEEREADLQRRVTRFHVQQRVAKLSARQHERLLRAVISLNEWAYEMAGKDYIRTMRETKAGNEEKAAVEIAGMLALESYDELLPAIEAILEQPEGKVPHGA